MLPRIREIVTDLHMVSRMEPLETTRFELVRIEEVGQRGGIPLHDFKSTCTASLASCEQRDLAPCNSRGFKRKTNELDDGEEANKRRQNKQIQNLISTNNAQTSSVSIRRAGMVREVLIGSLNLPASNSAPSQKLATFEALALCAASRISGNISRRRQANVPPAYCSCTKFTQKLTCPRS